MPESWRSFSPSFLTRWDVQCLFLPWEAKSSLELGAEQFTKQAEDESQRKRLGMHYLNSYSHLKPQRAPGAQDTAQFIFLTQQKNSVVPQEIKPIHRNCFVTNCHPICVSSWLAATQPRCSLGPAWDLLQSLQLLGENSPKLGQQLQWLQVEAIVSYLFHLFISSLAADLANNH